MFALCFVDGSVRQHRHMRLAKLKTYWPCFWFPPLAVPAEESVDPQWSRLAEVIFRHSCMPLQNVSDRLRPVHGNAFNIDSNRQFSDISGAGTFAACLRG
jgi:hypothetical protein